MEGCYLEAYVITDGERFMYENCQGKYVPAHCLDMADTYTKRKSNGNSEYICTKIIRKIYRGWRKSQRRTKRKICKSEDKKDILNCSINR